MDIFKIASQKGLRIQTSKGLLSVEQLWSLSIEELDSLAVSLEKEYNESGKKSFIYKKSEKDKLVNLKFKIVLEVLTNKADEAEELQTAKDNKEHNEKIFDLIAEKETENMKGKSIKELKGMLRN